MVERGMVLNRGTMMVPCDGGGGTTGLLKMLTAEMGSRGGIPGILGCDGVIAPGSVVIGWR